MDENKSGKYITNFPAISKNEEKRAIFFGRQKIQKYYFGLEIPEDI